MLMIARRFVAGDPPWRQRQLAEHLEIPGSALSTVIDSLESAGLVSVNEEEDVVPARDLESIDLCDILNAVRDERQYETWLLGRARTDPDADAVAVTVESAIRERVAGRTLREFASPPAG
jgi:DNA-binding IscR family transcriptional regulator